jgi:hypothetical protein
LSNVQGADSKSVDELLEQGNAFEADVVKGVEDAGEVDEGEVRTVSIWINTRAYCITQLTR